MRMGCCSDVDPDTPRARRICGTVLLLTLCVLPGRAAAPEAFLDTPVDKFEADWGEEMFGLCRTLDRPCGEEGGLGHDTQSDEGPKLHLTNTSPRKILDEITRRFPQYQWVMRDDVLTLEPAKTADRTNLLSRRLDHVSVYGKPSLRTALDVLRQAKISVTYYGIGPPSQHGLIDLELKDVTVREALNAIAKADGQVFWAFHPWDAKKATGNFALSTWRGWPRPEPRNKQDEPLRSKETEQTNDGRKFIVPVLLVLACALILLFIRSSRNRN